MCSHNSEKRNHTIVTAQMRSLLCQGRKSQHAQGDSHQPLISNFQLVRLMAKDRGQTMKHISAISQEQNNGKLKKKNSTWKPEIKPGTQVTVERNEAKHGETIEELSHRPKNKSQGTEHGTP